MGSTRPLQKHTQHIQWVYGSGTAWLQQLACSTKREENSGGGVAGRKSLVCYWHECCGVVG